MSHIGFSGPQSLIDSPEDARLVCEYLADVASRARQFSWKKSYAVLRNVSADELFYLNRTACRQGADAFRHAFGPVYNRESGKAEVGPLFEEAINE